MLLPRVGLTVMLVGGVCPCHVRERGKHSSAHCTFGLSLPCGQKTGKRKPDQSSHFSLQLSACVISISMRSSE